MEREPVSDTLTRIRLAKDWVDHKAGAVIEVDALRAAVMIERKEAEPAVAADRPARARPKATATEEN